MSVYIGAVTGFIFLISICFCIGDINATAGSATGVPLIQIFYDSTNSVAGACVLASLIAVIVLVCAMFLLAEGSRSLFAFARDHGLPFSHIFAKVEKKRQVPIYAILLACGVQLALNSIYFGTVTGFNTVISIATEGFCELTLAVFFKNVCRTNHTTCSRSIIRHASFCTYPRSDFWSCEGTSRPLYLGEIRNRLERCRLYLPALCFSHFQLSYSEPGGSKQHELHLSGNRSNWACQYSDLVHHRPEELYRPRYWDHQCQYCGGSRIERRTRSSKRWNFSGEGLACCLSKGRICI